MVGLLRVAAPASPLTRRIGPRRRVGSAPVGRLAANRRFDRIDGGDPLQRLSSDGRGLATGELNELPTDMRLAV